MMRTKWGTSTKSQACPKCGASADKRVPSGGFGRPHDVCSSCGHEFEEFTCKR